jgi:hypothetical protein
LSYLDIEAISRLFAELIKCGLFSNLKYMYRLISRGDFTPKKINTDRTLRHVRYIRWFPMQSTSQHQLNQRKRMLDCVDSGKGEIQETKLIQGIMDIILEKLSHPFGDNSKYLTRWLLSRIIMALFILDTKGLFYFF